MSKSRAGGAILKDEAKPHGLSLRPLPIHVLYLFFIKIAKDVVTVMNVMGNTPKRDVLNIQGLSEHGTVTLLDRKSVV